ncbi:S9 family peptidase [Chondrinema litorale]|uniref:S9 family peptidase n=1 Tax=Chondrinema litorale TaxID=2994555 RepID=UPI0025428B95|nr:S9 family peptidase [Chondrinema litorale]UZR98139.1 S9 family peptidase [Chondrinema litorale]
MQRTKQSLILYLLLTCLPFSILAQSTDPSMLDLNRIFSQYEFYPDYFGPARWIDEGDGYTTIERSENGGQDIVRYETKTGEKEILIAATDLIPEGAQQPLSIANYDWSDDKSKLLIFTNTARVWRTNTKGDYWVLDVASKKLQKLGGSEAKPSTLMFAKFAPQSDRVAYVREHNIFVEDLQSAKITQLTFDGTVDIINGTFDWVYEEEFQIQDGFRWSPDGKSIAFWQLDATDIKDFLMINNTDSIYSYTIPVQYPKVGQDNSACKIGAVSAAGGDIVWMNVPGDPKNNYIPRMMWTTGSDAVLIQHMNRKQNTNDIMRCDVKSGEAKTIYTDKDAAWLDVVNDWKWMNEGKNFTWVSEKDGWKHVYLISADGKTEELITPGEFDIISIVNIDEKKGYLYYIASPENPTQRYLFRSKLSGKGSPEKLTPESLAGTNGYNISPNSKWAFHSYSAAGTPSETNLVSLPKHETERVLVANKELKEKVAALKKTPIEFFRVDIGDGVELDAYMMKPYNFDPNKKYPVLFHVYGEPWNQTVVDSWGGMTYLWHLMLTQQGYIVMSIDNRGTPAPRGRDWRKIVYGQIGILASADQANGVKKIIEKYDFVDADRIGIWGWSGGGSMTLNAMFRYPEVYKMGMSVAPVTLQFLYDNVYQERYMGLPWENKEGYIKGSPITYAKNLEGKLLIMHGTGDDNVHYQNTEMLINELVRQNKIFSLMSYPNRSHGIYEGQNTSRHVREMLTWYLKNNL